MATKVHVLRLLSQQAERTLELSNLRATQKTVRIPLNRSSIGKCKVSSLINVINFLINVNLLTGLLRLILDIACLSLLKMLGFIKTECTTGGRPLDVSY